jgi:hypothetical protein
MVLAGFFGGLRRPGCGAPATRVHDGRPILFGGVFMLFGRFAVLVMAKELDTPPQPSSPAHWMPGLYTFVAADALVLRVREHGQVVSVHALIDRLPCRRRAQRRYHLAPPFRRHA